MRSKTLQYGILGLAIGGDRSPRPSGVAVAVSVACEACGTTFAIKPSRARRGMVRFCSRECRSGHITRRIRRRWVCATHRRLVSTSSSIASSWSAILAALSDGMRMSTTSTASSTTTALRTLSSLLAPITSQTTMPPCGCLLGGPASTAASAGSSSTDEWASWLHTLSASAPESATEGIALAAASVCAQVAESLSVDLGAGSSAAQTATTGADASSSPAFEPIVVARKPLSGTVAANVLAHGTGALNIDGCRVGDEDDNRRRQAPGARCRQPTGHWAATRSSQPRRQSLPSGSPAGRWPANVILDEAMAERAGRAERGQPQSAHRQAARCGSTATAGA